MIRSRLPHRVLLRPNPLAHGFALALALGSGAALAGATPNPAHASSLIPAATTEGNLRPPAIVGFPEPTEPPRRFVGYEPATLPPDSVPVTNCNDSGPGSLRDAVSAAGSGDTIDLTNTGCSIITLSTGAIGIGQTTLTLQGPGSSGLAISGNSASQVLLHTGGGTLYVNGLTIQAGEKYQTSAQTTPARGGCIASTGSVYLSDSLVKYCTAKDTSDAYGAKGGAIYGEASVTVSYSTVRDSSAYSTGSYSRGGGIYTPGLLTLDHSVVSGNESKSNSSSGRATGGGIETRGGMLVKYSTIDGNDAYDASSVTFGGGVYALGNSAMTIENSTVSNNSADDVGGVVLAQQVPSTPITLLSSTVSGNSAGVIGGVEIFNCQAARIGNSTIVFNATPATSGVGSGLYVDQSYVDLESTLMAWNTDNGFPVDITAAGTSQVNGANNLIRDPWTTVPADTITGTDPLLSPLADNGGPTWTHAISFDSPAIDAGNDAASVAYDQRGPGHARVIGANADIGAFEADTSDRIFADGFD